VSLPDVGIGVVLLADPDASQRGGILDGSRSLSSAMEPSAT